MIKNNDYLNRRLDGDSLVNLHSLECTAQESSTSTKLGNFNVHTPLALGLVKGQKTN